MAFGNATFGVLDQVLDNIQRKQSGREYKANTVTTFIGAAFTAVVAGATYIIESGTESVPDWLPTLVAILGGFLTVIGVNQTKNGLTDSLRQRIHDEISDMIDSRAETSPPSGLISDPVPPVVEDHEPRHALQVSDDAAEEIADELDQLAKRFARGDDASR